MNLLIVTGDRGTTFIGNGEGGCTKPMRLSALHFT